MMTRHWDCPLPDPSISMHPRQHTNLLFPAQSTSAQLETIAVKKEKYYREVVEEIKVHESA